MKNRLAIVYCIHHKPWLIMSTLITTLIQTYKDYDMYFLYQKGDGTSVENNTYKEYFKEYYALVNEYGNNKQLDTYDSRTIAVCQISGKNIHELHFQNDHALDSGAWYKFIRTKLWQEYDYVMFMGEGALFTGETVLDDTLHFAQKNNIHFITGSQEKRRIPKDRFLNGFASSKNRSKMTIFHDQMIKETFDVFCRDSDFRKVLEMWPSDFEVEQQHHVPDIWGYNGFWMKVVNMFYPRLKKNESFFKYQIKHILSLLNNWLFRWIQMQSKMDIYLKNCMRIKSDNLIKKENDDYIYVNRVRKRLKDVVDYKTTGAVKFHKSNKPEWYGATCNHFVSKEFLERFSQKLEKYKVYDVIDLPFSATALEIIWGVIPCWLGFDKWFFNGIHRVRKNFVTYRREDDPAGMVRYINRYYRGKLCVNNEGDFIKINKCSHKYETIKDYLNSFYLLVKYH